MVDRRRSVFTGWYQLSLTCLTVLGRLLSFHVGSRESSRTIAANFFSVIESLISVVYWFPFYFTFKFIFLLWLSLPAFRYVACPLVLCFVSNVSMTVAPISSSARSLRRPLAATSIRPLLPAFARRSMLPMPTEWSRGLGSRQLVCKACVALNRAATRQCELLSRGKRLIPC